MIKDIRYFFRRYVDRLIIINVKIIKNYKHIGNSIKKSPGVKY